MKKYIGKIKSKLDLSFVRNFMITSMAISYIFYFLQILFSISKAELYTYTTILLFLAYFGLGLWVLFRKIKKIITIIYLKLPVEWL